eukprot:2747428-Pyramimonas_sp.AAC.1
MARAGAWLLPSALLVRLAGAGKKASKRPACCIVDHPEHPVFEVARRWARCRAEFHAERGYACNFASPDVKLSTYNELFRE